MSYATFEALRFIGACAALGFVAGLIRGTVRLLRRP